MPAKTYIVYPRLPKPAAKKIIDEIRDVSIDELHKRSTAYHKSAVYAATGNRVRESELEDLQSLIRNCAGSFGYPDPENTSQDQSRDFDAECAAMLHRSMELQPSEAAHIEMWTFITCVLVPDIVRWRYWGDSTATERFIGSNRGLRRNAVGRLWWRAYLLYQKDEEDPYSLIPQLNEDDYAALMERSSIASNPILVTAASKAFIQASAENPDLTRRDIVREAAKRIRRLLSFIAYEAMDEDKVQEAMESIFAQTVEAIR